jgi:hypothetical protein
MAIDPKYKAQFDEKNNKLYEIDSKIDQLKNKFDEKYYLKSNPDVARDAYYGKNALEHWNRNGQFEGRFANEYQQNIAKNIPNTEVDKLEAEKTALTSDLKNLQIEASIGSLSSSPIEAKKTSSLPGLVSENNAVSGLSAERNYGASPLAAKLNFQVSDDQILNDYNTAKLDRYKRVVELGNTQAVGIQERLIAAQKLLDTLPANSAQRTASDVYVDGLKKDLASVRSAVSDATSQIGSFKPLAVGSPEAAKEITSFRSFLQLPEERASQQLRQIDPESYETSIELGKKYREMAAAPIGETKSAQAEQLRSNLEQEAINQLALGSQLGAEEQRQYQQAARAAQTARGNIFGVAPAVEEAVTTGLAGEQRKLARYGAATQFLASGQNTSDALKSDIAFRDALLQNRLGAASGFVAGGPSIYNLGQARTAQQQGAFQNYIQANQALPGGFNQQPSTAAPFYQAVDQGIPVNLTNTFANLYGSQANYLANTYGAQVGALSRQETGSQAFGNIASGLGNLFSFNKSF